MSLVIAAFDSTRAFLCSEGRAVTLDGYGKVRIDREDAFKHLQISESLVIAATGAARFAGLALAMARDIGDSFGGRCTDLGGAMVDLFTRLVKRVPDKLPDCPSPLTIVILSKNSLTRRVTCALLASGCDPQRFDPPPDFEGRVVILSPRIETSRLVKYRMDAVLPEIFRETHNANFRAKVELVNGRNIAAGRVVNPRETNDAQDAFMVESAHLRQVRAKHGIPS